jgi:hypothetical protein
VAGHGGACLTSQDMQERKNRRIVVQACPDIKEDTVSKIVNIKQASGVSQAITRPTTAKKKKEKERKKEKESI